MALTEFHNRSLLDPACPLWLTLPPRVPNCLPLPNQIHLDLMASACAFRTWAVFYSQRWRAPAITPPEWRWQAAFGSKLRTLNAYSSHCQTDSLYGHSDCVRACALLPAQNLLVTGRKCSSYQCDQCRYFERNLSRPHESRSPRIKWQ